jgi:hypothetical protein
MSAAKAAIITAQTTTITGMKQQMTTKAAAPFEHNFQHRSERNIEIDDSHALR